MMEALKSNKINILHGGNIEESIEIRRRDHCG